MKNTIKKYRVSIIMVLVLVLMNVFIPSKGQQATDITMNNVYEMIKIIPPIFILLGLLDVWVPREKMIKYMGDSSGIVGVLIAFLLGSAAAGPLYAAFPIAGTLLKKGASFYNVLIFIGAWSTTKIPLLLFEASSLGWKFTLIRLGLDIIGIWMIAGITYKTLNEKDRQKIYKISEDM